MFDFGAVVCGEVEKEMSNEISDVLLNNFPEAATAQTQPPQALACTAQNGDKLLEALDQIVAGSHWGDAPLLSRSEANQRDAK